MSKCNTCGVEIGDDYGPYGPQFCSIRCRDRFTGNDPRSVALERIKEILNESDIVWTKYGSETITELAEKIYET